MFGALHRVDLASELYHEFVCPVTVPHLLYLVRGEPESPVMFLQIVKVLYYPEYVFRIRFPVSLPCVEELCPGVCHAAEMHGIYHLVVKIQVDVVSVRLQCFRVAPVKNRLQRVAAPGTFLVEEKLHIFHTPNYYCLKTLNT